MALPTLVGSFPLTQTSINNNVTKKSPGVYVLGTTSNKKLPVKRSGRSDDDVAKRIADHIGKYDDFMYAYCSSASAAFYAECELHHEYSPSDNVYHPDRPAGTNLKCPRCSLFD